MKSPRLRTGRFDSPEQEAYLNLWRTYDRLRAFEDDLFAAFDLTPQQYNVLRLLDSAPEGVRTLSLADRLVSRAPDVTRILDKLEMQKWVRRRRSDKDRRTVMVSITAEGRALVKAVAGPLRACHARQLGHMPAPDLSALIALLQAAREPHEPPDSPWIFRKGRSRSTRS
ncbi:MAG TPA: MarR family winged helix-turn-helix transcriptional regulator [Fimbriiglobus sp.]